MYTNWKCSFIQEDDKLKDWRQICEDFEIEVVTDTDSDGEETKKEKKKKKHTRISSDSDTCEETQLMKKNKIISDSSDSEAKKGEKISEIDVEAQLHIPIYVSEGHFKCPACDFFGKSMGKDYSHMVYAHGMTNFTCDYCIFTT